jgi:uncharacterized membrane protein
LDDPLPYAAAGDCFFLAYICLSTLLLLRFTHEDLDRRANLEDEGVAVVFVIALAAISFNTFDIFHALNQAHLSEAVLVSALAGAPLGWAMLHMIYAHHYANLFYYGPDLAAEDTALNFPGTERPGPSDFVYFSFVVGMTAQVSDVAVQTSSMRRAVIFHSIVSFFYNTVLIAMAVNAVVAVFQQAH